MTWYTFLLFVHIALAIVWIGGGLMMQFFGIRAMLAGPDRLAAFGGDVEWIGMRVLTPASLLAFVSGILLVFEGPWSFADDWIVIGLALFAVTFFAGMLFFGPESGRLGKLIQAQGVESPEVQARMGRLILFSRFDLVVLFLIVFDMAGQAGVRRRRRDRVCSRRGCGRRSADRVALLHPGSRPN